MLIEIINLCLFLCAHWLLRTDVMQNGKFYWYVDSFVVALIFNICFVMYQYLPVFRTSLDWEMGCHGCLLERLESSGTKIVMREPVLCQLCERQYREWRKQKQRSIKMNFTGFYLILTGFYVLLLYYISDHSMLGGRLLELLWNETKAADMNFCCVTSIDLAEI